MKYSADHYFDHHDMATFATIIEKIQNEIDQVLSQSSILVVV